MAIPRINLLLSVLIALLVCTGFGFVWGRSGHSELQTTLEDAKQQLDLAEARGEILDGRLSLYNNNFGDASRHFENAKVPLRRLKARYEDQGKRDAASSLDAAAARVDEAQSMAGKLDPSANSKAAAALEAIRAAAAAK